MKPTPTIIAALLGVLKALGLNQRTVAARLGVTRGLVTQWRTGVRPVAPRQFEAIQALLTAALEQALDADDWPTRRDAVTRAMRVYELSLHATAERITAGKGRQALQREAEHCGHIIGALMSRGAAAWSLADRLTLSVTAQRLDEISRLLTLIEQPDREDTPKPEEARDAKNARTPEPL